MSEIELKAFYNYLKSKSERTAAAYVKDARRFFKFIEKRPEEVKPFDASLWFQHLREQGYTERSINRFSWSLRRFFQVLGLEATSQLIETPDYVTPDPSWLNHDELEELLSHLPSQKVAFVGVPYDLALRIGEVSLLRRDRFNPEAREIMVFRLKHRGHPNRYTLPISDRWCKELVNYLSKRTDNDPRIFPYSSQAIGNTFRKARTSMGLSKDHTFQCLRHSKITHIAIDMIKRDKVDVVRLAKFAGHLRVDTTMRYIHLASEYLSFGELR